MFLKIGSSACAQNQEPVAVLTGETLCCQLFIHVHSNFIPLNCNSQAVKENWRQGNFTQTECDVEIPVPQVDTHFDSKHIVVFLNGHLKNCDSKFMIYDRSTLELKRVSIDLWPFILC